MRCLILALILTASLAFAACSGRNAEAESRAADVGRALAAKLHPDSGATDMQREAIVLDARHREALLRQQGRHAEADSLRAAFVATIPDGLLILP